MRLISVLTFVALALVSCSKDMSNPVNPGDYLIFGTFYGECLGNCSHFFMIRDGLLFMDDVEIGIPEEIPFTNDPMSSADYDLAVELQEEFPSDLTDSDKRIYGCPDCHDQGGVYLELNNSEGRFKWRIDTDDDEQSEAISTYKKRVMEVVSLLR